MNVHFCQPAELDDGRYYCTACGWGLNKNVRTPFKRECTASRGLGDTIAKVTRAIGINPCGGCDKRQEWLNKRFPYKGH